MAQWRVQLCCSSVRRMLSVLFVEVDAVVVLTSGITASTGMLAVLSYSAQQQAIIRTPSAVQCKAISGCVRANSDRTQVDGGRRQRFDGTRATTTGGARWEPRASDIAESSRTPTIRRQHCPASVRSAPVQGRTPVRSAARLQCSDACSPRMRWNAADGGHVADPTAALLA